MMFYVAYACNEAYKIQTMVSILSLCTSCREDDITILLAEDGMCRASLDDVRMLVKNCKKELRIVPLPTMLPHICLSGGTRHPRTIYAKLFLPRICQAEKILYLDSDTIVCRTLSPLMDMDMQGAYIAGVKMPYPAKKKALVGIPEDVPYLCDGILFMNLKKWRKDHLTEACIAHICKYGGQPPMLSEGTVNYVSRGLVKVLAPQYNLMSGMVRWSGRQLAILYSVDDYYSEQELKQAREYPAIVHYLNELYLRPWFRNSDHPYRGMYQAYFQTLENRSIVEKGKLRIRTRFLRMLDHILPFWLFAKIYRAVKG